MARLPVGIRWAFSVSSDNPEFVIPDSPRRMYSRQWMPLFMHRGFLSMPEIASQSSSIPEIILRTHRPGDMGWVVQAHGELYAREYGWNSNFEALIAEIVAAFLRQHDPERERCWIAERDGVRVGSIFLVRQSDEVAKLRLLLVDPVARGSGLGRRLVQECIGFARQAGYRTLVLWTNDVLTAARRIYASEGFRIVATERNIEFGPETVGETWELTL
jgi:GNAT superfamily N-acetyltransferase